MKFGDKVKIKGFDGFYDGVKAILIDTGAIQNPATHDTQKVYVVEIDDKYHKNLTEDQVESYNVGEDIQDLMENDNVQ